MTMGPAPIIMIELISVLLGMKDLLLFMGDAAWQKTQIVVGYRDQPTACKGGGKLNAFATFKTCSSPPINSICGTHR